jgi:hypothetical protein
MVARPKKGDETSGEEKKGKKATGDAKKSETAKSEAKKSEKSEKSEKSARDETSEHSSKTTTDHDEIRRWVEERGGRPSSVSSTHTDADAGILRIDFEEQEASLDEIAWEQFFATFEERKLAFLYQEKTKDGGTSRFFKFVRR